MGPVTAAYNSEGGWGVSTHSRISRSTKWGVPTYTNDDIFTIDGEELVYEAGTDGPRVYHTEHESYRKIAYYNTGTDGSYWKVFNQDGSWATYGYRDEAIAGDARILPVDRDNAAAQPRVWAIAESQDKGGYDITRYLYTAFDDEGQKIPPADDPDGAYYLDRIVSGKSGRNGERPSRDPAEATKPGRTGASAIAAVAGSPARSAS